MLAIKCHIYYRSCTSKNCWRCIDTHLQDRVGSVWLSLFTIKAASTLFMTLYMLEPPRLPKVHDQLSLTLRWRSFSGCGGVCISVHFDHQGGQYIKNNQWCTKLNSLRLTVAYLNATINSETWNTGLEIENDGSSRSRQNPWVDGYRSRVGLAWGRRSGFWRGLDPNWPVCAVRPRTAGRLPTPVAYTSLLWSAQLEGNILKSRW